MPSPATMATAAFHQQAAYELSGASYVRKIGWTTYTPNIWPELQPFVAADAQWIHHSGRRHADPGSRPGKLQLDPEHAIAVVSFTTD